MPRPKKRAKRSTDRGHQDRKKVSATSNSSPVQDPPESGTESNENQVETKEVTDIQQSSRLLKLPTEVRYKIWSYAVKHLDPIIPVQVQRKSNKFHLVTFPKDKKNGTTQRRNQPLPVAAILSVTCRQIYDEISSECLFYQLNHFKFLSSDDMLAYLVAITPLRAQSLRSISLDDMAWRTESDALLFLAWACQRLTELRLTARFAPHNYLSRSDEVQVIPKRGLWGLSFVRGLETFDLQFQDMSHSSYWNPQTPERIEKEARILKTHYEDLVTMPGPSPVTAKMINELKSKVEIDVFGDGRLGEDKKPGIVASRTRAALRRVLNDNGVLEDVPQHKFSINGDLLWSLCEVKESRQIEEDTGTGEVEVLCRWCGNTTPRVPRPESWENLDKIINVNTWHTIVCFYEKQQRTVEDIEIAIRSMENYLYDKKEQHWALSRLRYAKKKAEARAETEAARKAALEEKNAHKAETKGKKRKGNKR